MMRTLVWFCISTMEPITTQFYNMTLDGWSQTWPVIWSPTVRAFISTRWFYDLKSCLQNVHRWSRTGFNQTTTIQNHLEYGQGEYLDQFSEHEFVLLFYTVWNAVRHWIFLSCTAITILQTTFWVNVISFTAGFNRVVLFLENAFTEQFIGFWINLPPRFSFKRPYRILIALCWIVYSRWVDRCCSGSEPVSRLF